MICKKCAREIPGDAVCCCYCGTRLTAPVKKRRTHGNGGGSVYRYRGTWCAQVTASIDYAPPLTPDGLPRMKRTYLTKCGFATAKEARAYLPTLQERAKKPADTARHIPTIGELYAAYSTTAMTRIGASTRGAYATAWRLRVEPALADVPIDRLSVSMIDEIVAPLTYDTAHDVKDLLSVLARRAMADNLILSNPTQYVTLPEHTAARVEPWLDAEVESLWGAWLHGGDRIAASCLLMIYTGMMPGELFQLDRSMIDYDAHTITGCGLKTQKRKQAPIILPDFVIPVLRYLSESSTSRAGRVLGLNKDRFYSDFKALKERLGIRDVVRPYSGRHSTHVQLAQRKIPPALIVEIMRHKDYRTALEHYNQQDPSVLISALNTLAPRFS